MQVESVLQYFSLNLVIDYLEVFTYHCAPRIANCYHNILQNYKDITTCVHRQPVFDDDHLACEAHFLCSFRTRRDRGTTILLMFWLHQEHFSFTSLFFTLVLFFFSINFLFPFLLLVFFQVAETLNNPRCKKKLQMIGGRYFLNHYVLIRVPDKTLSRNEITAIST